MSKRALGVKKWTWVVTTGCTFAEVSLRISHRVVAVEICGNVFLALGLRNERLEITWRRNIDTWQLAAAGKGPSTENSSNAWCPRHGIGGWFTPSWSAPRKTSVGNYLTGWVLVNLLDKAPRNYFWSREGRKIYGR